MKAIHLGVGLLIWSMIAHTLLYGIPLMLGTNGDMSFHLGKSTLGDLSQDFIAYPSASHIIMGLFPWEIQLFTLYILSLFVIPSLFTESGKWIYYASTIPFHLVFRQAELFCLCIGVCALTTHKKHKYLSLILLIPLPIFHRHGLNLALFGVVWWIYSMIYEA